jgi:DNA-binding NarL/FixJ family response regulator
MARRLPCERVQVSEESSDPQCAPAPRLTRVVVVDDHPVCRKGIVALVNSMADFRVCGEADDVASGYETIARVRPEVAVVDISLRTGSGVSLIKQVRQALPETICLAFTVYPEAVVREQMLDAGAALVVRKDAAPAELIEALRSSTKAFAHGVDWRRSRPRQNPPTVSVNLLTKRELEIFQMLGEGTSARDIAVQLGVSRKTVNTHRENIKQKLGMHSVAEIHFHAVQWMKAAHQLDREREPAEGSRPDAEQ